MVTYVIASKANQPLLAQVRSQTLSQLKLIFFCLVSNVRRVAGGKLSWCLCEDCDQASRRMEPILRLCKLPIFVDRYKQEGL